MPEITFWNHVIFGKWTPTHIASFITENHDGFSISWEFIIMMIHATVPIILNMSQFFPQCIMRGSPFPGSLLSCNPGVRDKRRVSQIDLSQPRHETAFWWCHNGPVTSQLTDPIKWPNYPQQLIGIYVHINTHNKESLTQRCHRSTNVQLCLIFFTYMVWI